MNLIFQAFFLDEDGDVDPELMLAKKKAMDNAKTPVAAPELDTKPVKKADTPAAEKKPATKESKPISREGKPCHDKLGTEKALSKKRELKLLLFMFLWFVILFFFGVDFYRIYTLFGTLLLLKTIEKPIC